jgi:hypothetical protein
MKSANRWPILSSLPTHPCALSACLPVLNEMAKAVPSAPHVTLNLEVTGNFARSGSQQSPVDTQPLYLASNGVQGKLSLKYNESAFPIRSRDIVKVSLNGV